MQIKENSEEDAVFVLKTTVIYRNGYKALDNASFHIPPGTITAFIGMNGSGKTTLFKAIMGFIPMSTGTIRILGLPIKQAIRKNLVAYVPQNEEVDWSFPILVEEVVMMGRYGYMGMMRIPQKIDYDAVSEALTHVEMSPLGKRQINELSGGQKKRVFLARALAQKSQLILLDEPFTGVDLKTENQIIVILKQLRREGCTILVSTHNLRSVPEFCDHTVLVKKTILESGLTEKIFTTENLEKTFDGMLYNCSHKKR